MNRRLWIGFGAVIFLVVLAGCTSLGGATSESGLATEESYEWEQDTDVTIDLEEDSYAAVFSIENQSSVRVYQRTRYGTEHPVPIRALQFRYENGTVVNASEIGVSETRSSVHVHPPAETGQIAYTAPKRSNSFYSPVLVEGSWEVIVPPGHRVDNFVLGTVRPGASESTLENDRVHLTWSELSSRTVRVEYYLERDFYLFAGLLAATVLAGGTGVAYVYRQIQQLRREREDLGLTIETDSQDGPDPPGGFP